MNGELASMAMQEPTAAGTPAPRLIRESKHSVPLLCCAADARGRFALAGGRDSALACWELETGQLTLLEGHLSWVIAAVRCGESLILTADQVGRVIAWDCSGALPTIAYRIDCPSGSIVSLAVSPDGARFATGDRLGQIGLYQARDGERIQQITGLVHPVYALDFHPQTNRLASADRQPQKPRLKIWDLETGQEQRSQEIAELSAYRRVEDIEWGGIRAIRYSARGTTLVACGSNHYAGPACAMLFDSETGELKRKYQSSLKGFYYTAHFHPHGLLVTSGGDIGKGEVAFWSMEQDQPLATISTAGPCLGLDLTLDGRRAVTAQMIGKGSYPDSGHLALYEWTT